MKLTKKRAIEKSIELWEWLAETGEEWKKEWSGWDGAKAFNDCFLCEYTLGLSSFVFDLECKEYCPLAKGKRQFQCDKTTQPYHHWCEAKTAQTRKKYAKLFLEQLRGLL